MILRATNWSILASFLEDFFFGRSDPITGQTSGGVAQTPFAQFWGSALSTGYKALPAPARLPGQALGLGLQGIEFVESNVIARPVSTALQALNIANPLYRNGIQVEDFTRMWNASEYVSPGRAGITNIGTQFGVIQSAVTGETDQDWNEFSYLGDYNPYEMSPEELERRWDDSVLGTIGSTSLDTAFVVLAGGKGVNAAASGMKRAAGLSTSIKSQKDLTRLRVQGESGILWKESGGTSGKRTSFSKNIEEVAGLTDVQEILNSSLLKNWTRSGSFNADELAEQWAKISDERLILDMALADRGDVTAIGRLFREAPDTVWSLSDMNEVMARQFASGGQFVPDAQTARLYSQTFETAVQRDEFWGSVKNTFMTTDPNDVRIVAQPRSTITMQQGGTELAPSTGGLISGIRGPGSATMPIGTTGVPVISDAVGYAESWIKKTMGNAAINRPNSWNEISIPANSAKSAATRLLFWAGSRRPNNMVNFNSLRPTDVVDEMVSYSRSSRVLRNKEWTVTRPDADGIKVNVTMRDYEWRAEAIARLTRAKSQGDQPLSQVVRDLETELISVVGNRYGITATKSDDIARGLRDKSDSYQAQVARDGFWIDPDGARVVLDPVTRRQLPDSLVLMPLDELDLALRGQSAVSYAKRGRKVRQTVELMESGLDAVYRIFRTNVLFTGKYVPKNSIAEPAVAAMLADASLLPEGGLLQVAGRVGENTKRRTLQLRYGLTDVLPMSAARTSRRDLLKVQDEYELAVRELEEIDLRIDDLTSHSSPATQAKFLNTALDERRVAYAQLKDVEDRMGINDPVWKSVDELPTYTQLKDRVQLIDDAFNDSNFTVRAQARINQINNSVSGGARELSLTEDLTSARSRLSELETRRESLRLAGKNLGEDIKPLGTRRGGSRGSYQGQSKFDQVRGARRRLDPVATRRNESYARSVQYLEDRISEQALLVKNLEASRGSIRPLSNVESSEIAQLERLLAARAKSEAGELDPKTYLASLRSELEEIRSATFRVEPTAIERKKKLEQHISVLDGERKKLTDAAATRNLTRERAREREFSGADDLTIRGPSGTEYRVSGAFSDEPGQFGAALRADSSANMTAYQTSTGGARAGTRWKQSGSGETIKPFDPRYWDELSYVANRHVMGDDFATLFLQGKDQGEIIAWFRTPAGVNYRKQMGWTNDDIYGEAGVIRRTRDRINEYFPSPAARARLLEGGEVTPGQLQKIMGDLPIEDLNPIYGTGLEFIGNPAQQITRIGRNASDTLWRNLAAKPESRFGRWPFFQREYKRQMKTQISLIEEQGMTISGSTIQAMQRTARARALKEMENTFYNIRRMAGPIYAMRYLVGFPAAAYNTAYRYGRLAYRSPGNANVQAQAWMNAITFMGVDEDGNKVDNYRDAENIIISVPEEWNLPIDPSVRLKVESLSLATQEGGYLPTVTIPLQMAMMYKPDLEEWIKKETPDLYNTMFDYGTGTSPRLMIGPVPLDPLLGGYQRRAMKYVQSFFDQIPDEDFARVTSQDYQYKMFQWSNNNERGPLPKWEDSAKAARDYYGIGTLVSNLIPGSYYLAPEGQYYRDEWSRIREKHPDDFPAAQAEMIDLYGPGSWFIMRPTSINRASMPPTAEGYAIFTENENLLRAAREIDRDNPNNITQLMFLDSQDYDQDDFSRAVYDWQGKNSLPGEDEPILSRMSPQEIEDEIDISRSWAMYNAAVAKRDGLMMEYGYTQLRADGDSDWLYREWQEWENNFESDEDNRLWFNDKSKTDRGKALRAIAGIDEFLNDSKWMSTRGKSITWRTISDYRAELDVAREAYDFAETPDERKNIGAAWDSYVRTWFLPQGGNFSNYYERFLSGKDISGDNLLEDRRFNIPQYPIGGQSPQPTDTATPPPAQPTRPTQPISPSRSPAPPTNSWSQL